MPADPVTIDQRGCVYRPRVIGLRLGQTLKVRNSDDGLHNVHGVSTPRDSFNVGQPMRRNRERRFALKTRAGCS